MNFSEGWKKSASLGLWADLTWSSKVKSDLSPDLKMNINVSSTGGFLPFSTRGLRFQPYLVPNGSLFGAKSIRKW